MSISGCQPAGSGYVACIPQAHARPILKPRVIVCLFSPSLQPPAHIQTILDLSIVGDLRPFQLSQVLSLNSGDYDNYDDY